MRILTVLTKNDAEIFNKSKTLETTELSSNYDKSALEVISEALDNNTGYEGIPIIGITKIRNEAVKLEKHFDELPALLSVGAGDYLLELDINIDECLTADYNTFLEFESSFEEKLLNTERTELINKFLEAVKIGSQETNETELGFIPKIRLKNCKCFAMLTEDWGQEDVKLAGIKVAKLNKLMAFKK